MTPPKRKFRREAAQSMAELAMSFTMLMFLFAGAVDLGRALWALISIRDAAEEGAVYGSLFPTDTSGIIAHTRQSSNNPINLSDVTAVNVFVNTLGGSCAGSGNAIQVIVTYNLLVTTPLIGVFFPGNVIPLSATINNTILRPAC